MTARRAAVLRTASLAFAWTLLAGSATAGEVTVTSVEAARADDGTYFFAVGLKHADVGWDHYANAWHVVAPDGTILGTRTLYHPHVNEQPFVRSLSGVQIPAGITEVTIVGVDSVHGGGGTAMTVKLPGR